MDMLWTFGEMLPFAHSKTVSNLDMWWAVSTTRHASIPIGSSWVEA
jgi:hypothetical protein